MSVESIARVLRHSQAKGTAKLVLVGIANHDGDGGAWPSIEPTLTTYANADRRTVQRAIRTLVEMGELVVHEQDGGTRATRNDRRPNRYEITVTPREPAVTNGAASTPPRGGDGAASMTERGGAGVALGAAPTPPEPSSNPTEPKTSPSPHAATTEDDGFAAFWAVYPRRAGKAAARRAWDKTARRAFASDIIAGAQRFADDPNREDAFTPHPATWLNQDRWEDEPLPPRGGRANTTDRVSRGMDVVRRMAEAEGVALGNVRMIGGGR